MIIAISTVTKECSVLIMHNNNEYFKSYINIDMIEILPLIIQEFPNKADLQELEKVFVIRGPGYHTGTRIGISFAKGLAVNIKDSIVYGDSLEILAYMYPEDGFITTLLKARNGIYHFAIFNKRNGIIERLSENEFVEEDNLTKRIKGNVIGEGVKYLKKSITDLIKVNDIYYPDAKSLYNFFTDYPQGLQ